MDGYQQASYGPSNGVKLEPYAADWSSEPEPGHNRPVNVSRPERYPESYVAKNETRMEPVQPPVMSKHDYHGPTVGHGGKSSALADEQLRRPMSPAHDRLAHDRPAYDHPAQDRRAHDSPTHIRPAPDSPARSRLAHDSQAHGSTHDRPTNGSTHDRPTQGSTPDRPTHGSTHDRPTHGSTHERQTQGPTHDRPTHGSTHDRPTHGSTHGRPTHGSTHGGTAHNSPTRGHPTHDRPAHNAPTLDSPSRNRPTHDSPTHSRPGHDRLAYDHPTHDRAAHYNPTQYSPPVHDRAAHYNPTQYSPPAHDSPTQNRYRSTHDRPPEVEQSIDTIQTEVSQLTSFSTPSPQDRKWAQQPHLANQNSMNRQSRFIIPLRGAQDEPNPRSYNASQPTRFHTPPQSESWYDDRQPARFPMPSQTGGWHQDPYKPNLVGHHVVGPPGRSQPGGLHVRPQPEPWHQDPYLGRNNSWPRKGTNGAIESHAVAYEPNSRASLSPTNSFRRPTDTRLSKPTNSIESALEYLKVATKGLNGNSTPPTPSSPHSPHFSAVSSPKRGFSTEMDSREDVRMYGSKGYSVIRTVGEETYGGAVIDSREAARRYNGALV